MSTVTTPAPAVPAMPPPPEDALYEIVDGKYEALPPMSTQASIVATRLVGHLIAFTRGQQLGEVACETLFGLTARAAEAPPRRGLRLVQALAEGPAPPDDRSLAGGA